jgi:hypothetical protein
MTPQNLKAASAQSRFQCNVRRLQHTKNYVSAEPVTTGIGQGDGRPKSCPGTSAPKAGLSGTATLNQTRPDGRLQFTS